MPTPAHTLVMDLALDADDYPDDGTLDAIRQWTGTAGDLIDAVAGIWPSYGRATSEVVEHELTGEQVRQIVLVTGGWSGCESLISALHDTLLWTLSWRESRAGGRHVLELSAAIADTDLVPIVSASAETDQARDELLDAALRGGLHLELAHSLLNRVEGGRA